MNEAITPPSPHVKPLPIFFLLGLVLVNLVAIFKFDPLYIGSFLSFFYVIIVPGLLLLPFLTKKRFPLMFGLIFSIALSVLMLMVLGLGINTILPFFRMNQPLTTLPLLLAFDGLIYVLLGLNFLYKKNSPLETSTFNTKSWICVFISSLLPLIACLGAISLNNGGSNILSMVAYGLSFSLILAVILTRNDIDPSVPPLTLYMMALSFLLMNSMRGWFITGHDILLEYHVFTLVNTAHYWSMALYRDAYMACLSLTILPVYLQNLLHVSGTYIFKFFLQFLGAGAVVIIYYLSKEYVSDMLAFLTAFLYISFPTFMTDMAFLNRQGIAFLFFAALIFVLLTTKYFTGQSRTFVLFLLLTGMVLSHYSTSYVAIALLALAYIINWGLRWAMNAKQPHWFSGITGKITNKEIYDRPIRLTFLFVLGLLSIIFLWSTVITQTSSNVFATLQQIGANIENPFASDHAGIDQYSLVKLSKLSPQALFDQFIQQTAIQAEIATDPSNLFSPSVTKNYTPTLTSEPLISLTSFGKDIESMTHIDLANFYNGVKQIYAYAMQILLLVGLLGLAFGYSFKKNLLRSVPSEYIAISIAGVLILVGQTLLPSSDVDYGLLRLFQQNLIFLGLPIMLGLFSIFSFMFRSDKKRLGACSIVVLIFFGMLSGLIPEITGGGRPALPLNNYGFYYDGYYTHAQEISSIDWIAQNGDPQLPVQSDQYFSSIKLLGYGSIYTLPIVLPETIEKKSYVYLGYNNTKNGTFIEYVSADVVYYYLPVSFLKNNKSLIYNNGGSEIYE